MKKYLILVIVSTLVLFVGLVSHAFCLEGVNKQSNKKPELSGKVVDGVREIKVVASRYKFVPDPILVKLGEKVRLIVTTVDVTHGLSLPEFKINLGIEPGETETAEFVADKEGSFGFFCSVYCGPGHPDMHGKFIVIKE
jgi:cytochrome c oxidase subunit 2